MTEPSDIAHDEGLAPEGEPAAAPPQGEVPVEEIAQEDPLARAIAERDEYLDSLQRLKAEFDNYRRRAERDRLLTQKAGIREVVTDLLPVMDNLERALASIPGGGSVDGVVAGVEMVCAQLSSLLTTKGVTEIPARHTPFDPTVHEAIAQTPSEEHPEGTVLEVVQKGYTLDDAVARPARVVVASAPVPPVDATD